MYYCRDSRTIRNTTDRMGFLNEAKIQDLNQHWTNTDGTAPDKECSGQKARPELHK